MVTRTNDITIMDALSESCSLSGSQLASINSVRLFLQVLTLSDITSLEGTVIERWAVMGTEPRKSSLSWPVQVKPENKALTL